MVVRNYSPVVQNCQDLFDKKNERIAKIWVKKGITVKTMMPGLYQNLAKNVMESSTQRAYA